MTIRWHNVWPFGPIILVIGLLAGAPAATEGAKSLYTYSDDTGTRVITDDYNKIPPAYRTRVTAVTQETDGYNMKDLEHVVQRVSPGREFVIEMPGMSFEQSKIITYAGAIALLCVLAMNFSRSEAIRLLALWSLVLTAIGAPVLVYVADDGAAAIMKNKAQQIQQKHQDRLSQAP
jgi:hypothetical protein